jgi:NADH:ubiquinone oxidoreductase subunit F (NADH-binding)
MMFFYAHLTKTYAIVCEGEITKIMPKGKSTEDSTTLQMALVGYELQKQKIDEKIREIQGDLRGRGGAAFSAANKNTGAPKRTLSVAARRRIAAAQRKRWAEHRKRMAAARGE